MYSRDPASYWNFLRMDAESFTILLHEVSPLICRQNTRMRECISAAERLSITLRYLATGNVQLCAVAHYEFFVACTYCVIIVV